ncbi:c-type cytochrome [Blattabacterium cuenoti]|uniref:c-type cytochrome n=1 Tax=Blattabacterium cuenoti TaxID=1653831 RepID=UPI00163C4879|nr:cytochrome c [Blattabacterium cuenoti]
MIKYYSRIVIVLLFSICCNSCWFNKQYPNIVYMPDMYYSDAYEPYSDPYPYYKSSINKIKINPFVIEQTSSITSVEGTIPRNYYESFSKYTQDNTNHGYFQSKKIIESPLQNKENKVMNNIFQDGKKIYTVNCAICHGNLGDGEGYLVKSGKILGIPNYKDRSITVGSIYHVITYGKNNMSSYASQLNKLDRWKVSEYVMLLKNKLTKSNVL